MPNFRQGTELQSIHVTDVDPTVGAGIPGGTPNMLLLRTDNNSIYYFAGPLDTDWRQVGSGGGATVSIVPGSLSGNGAPASPLGSHVFLWDRNTSWADIYAAMQQVSGPKILLVEFDPVAGQRVITNDGTPQDWNDIYFWAMLGQGQGTSLFIIVNAGLTLVGKTVFSRTDAFVRSRDISWEFNASSIYNPSGSSFIEFDIDGGALTCPDVLVTGRVSLVARNRADIRSGDPGGLFACDDNGSRATLLSGAVLTASAANPIFRGTGANLLNVFAEPSVAFRTSDAFQGVTLTLNVLNRAKNAANAMYQLSIDGGGNVIATLV